MNDKADTVRIGGSYMLLPAHLVESKLDELAAAGLRGYATRAQAADLWFDAYALAVDPTSKESTILQMERLLRIINPDAGARRFRLRPKMFEIDWNYLRAVCVYFADQDAAKIEIDLQEWTDIVARERVIVGCRAYQKLLAKFCGLTGLKVRLISKSEGFNFDPEPEKPGTVSVLSNCSPPGVKNRVYRYTLFGHRLDDKAEPPACAKPLLGRGVVLKDEHGEPAVQIIGQTAYLLCPIFGVYHGADSEEIFWKLLCLIKQGLDRSEDEDPESADLDENVFIKTVGRQIDDWPGLIESKLKEQSAEIERLQSQIMSCQRATAEYRDMLDGAERNARRARRTMRKDFRRLSSHPDIERVRQVKDGMLFDIKPVVIEHDGHRYATGRFTIALDPVEHTVVVWNDRPLHPNGHSHPHLERDNTPCFGNVGVAIYQAVAEWRIFDAIDLVLRWLKHGYTPELARYKVEGWPLAGDDGEPLPLEAQSVSYIELYARVLVNDLGNPKEADLIAWSRLLKSLGGQAVLATLKPALRTVLEVLLPPVGEEEGLVSVDMESSQIETLVEAFQKAQKKIGKRARPRKRRAKTDAATEAPAGDDPAAGGTETESETDNG